MKSNTWNAPYFKHFCDLSRRDRQRELIRVHGAAAYGAYLILLELLAGSKDGKYPYDLDILAHILICDKVLVKSIICDFGLFIVDTEANTFEANDPFNEMGIK